MNNKFTKKLLHLDSSEFGRLIDLMKSPYFVNQSTPLASLFQLMMDLYPRFEETSAEIIFSKLFPNEKFKPKKIRDLFSDLTLLIEEFLVIEFLKKRKSRLHQLKSLIHYENGHFKDFHKEANKALTHWEQQENIYDSFEKLALYQHIHYYPYAEKQNQRSLFLIDANELTDQIYILSKLRYYCEVQTGKAIYAQVFEPTFNEEVFLMADKIRDAHPLIDLYLCLIYLNTSKQVEIEFLETQEKFHQLFPLLTPFESSIIITLLLNFCGLQYFKKNVTFLQYQFQLQKFGLSHQLFSLYGYFNHTTFMNIVITASGIKDFEFINSFLTQSLPKLKTTYRSKCKQLGQAYKDFAKRDYANANQKVLFLEDKTIFFSLRARFLALRCNFEFLMEDFNQEEPFSSHCQSFKIFINKQHKSLSAFRRDSYLNHIKILENIAKSILLTGHIDFKKSKELSQIIQSTSPLVGWQYLQEKLQQLTK